MNLSRKTSLSGSKRRIIPSKLSDPFSNMIHRDNKSPSLKPVCVKSKKNLLNSVRSDSKFIKMKYLPPISPTNRHVFPLNSSCFDRKSLQTPNFRIPNKMQIQREFKNQSELKSYEISFGDLED
jgi:hypothetical protein